MALTGCTVDPGQDIFIVADRGEIEVQLDLDQQPPRATAAFSFGVNVTHLKSGAKAPYFDEVVIHLVKRGGKWLVADYSTAKDWRRDASRL